MKRLVFRESWEVELSLVGGACMVSACNTE
jgi:hypothetical protein